MQKYYSEYVNLNEFYHFFLRCKRKKEFYKLMYIYIEYINYIARILLRISSEF